MRLPGLVAHQEVIFGGEGQTLSDPPRLDRPPLLHARRAARRAQGRRACPTASRSASRSCSRAGYGYPDDDERAARSHHRDGDAVRRGRGGRRGRGPPAGRATCSSTARTGWSSPARPASAPTLTDERGTSSCCGRSRRGRRRGAAGLRHRHQRHPPLDRADQGGRRGRRRRRAGRHALLQQAQPGRHPRPLRGGRRGGPGAAAGRLQHPLAGDRQRRRRAARPSWPRSTTSSRSSRPTTTSCGPIEGLDVLAGNDDIFLRDARVRRRRRHPRRLAPGRRADARDLGRGAGRRPRARARDRRRACARSTRRSASPPTRSRSRRRWRCSG